MVTNASTANTTKANYIDVGREGEIITDSILTRYNWPDNDPRQATMVERPLTTEEMSLLQEASNPYRLSLDSFWERHQTHSVPTRLLELLNHRAVQFNNREDFRTSSTIFGRITAACNANRPVEIILPVFCVISNPAKRLQQTVVTAGEEVSLRYLGEIAKIAQELYSPGIIFHIVSDSTFYALPFEISSVEAQNYIRSLRDCVSKLHLENVIQIHDMSDLVATHLEAFDERFGYWWRELERNPLADGISEGSYSQWVASMAASINTRRLDLAYNELRQIFGAGPDSKQTSIVAAETYKKGQNSLAVYRALKAAIADLRWDELCFPDGIRATIHTKRIPVLGIRLYPEYKFSSNLLPYHGIAVLTYSKKARQHRMSIQPELMMVGQEGVERIVDADGITSFYHDLRNHPDEETM